MLQAALPNARAEVRGLRRSLAEASDDQVLSAVRVVDAMAARGTADELIAPLRPRLAQLRPARPLSPTRLLFSPLDGAIVPITEWSPGALAVPRSALLPLAELVWGSASAALDALCGATPALPQGNVRVLAQAGEPLWRLAADRLSRAEPQAGMRAAHGMPEAEFAALTRRIASVLRVGAVLVTAPALGADARESAAAKALADTAARDPDAVGLLTAVLLARLPDGASVLAALARLDAKLPGVVEAVGERVLDGLERGLDRAGKGAGGLGADAAEAHKLADTLAALEAQASGPTRKRRVAQLRKQADAACREGFQRVLASELSGRLASLPPGNGTATAQEVAALEAAARNARQLEQAGRRLGGGPAYDAALKAVAAPLAKGGGGLTVADRVRLTELLLGLEAALALAG